jgi:hypothetical protein
MGILLTKVTHGVCDPKELRETTSCSYILSFGSLLSNTQLFAGRPRHQRRPQTLASPRSGLPIHRTPDKIYVWETMKLQRQTQSTKGRSWVFITNTWRYAWLLANAKSFGDAWKRAQWHTETCMSGLVTVRCRRELSAVETWTNPQGGYQSSLQVRGIKELRV